MNLMPTGTPIGQGPVIHDIAIQVVVSCLCQASGPLVIRHLTHQVTCPACQRRLFIVEAHGSTNGRPTLNVRIGVREPDVVLPPGARVS